MNEAAITSIIAKVMAREGAIADVGDGMGVTRWGQTPAWLESFQLPVPQTMADAAGNYHLWLSRTRLDALCSANDALADIVIDYAVNSGVGRAVKSLQIALGVTTDGILGPNTLDALTLASRRRLACQVLAEQVARDGSNIAGNPALAKFAAGWANRWAEHIRALAEL